MNNFLNKMKTSAKADRKTIVLPEGDDERTLKAARIILDEDIADLILIGSAEKPALEGAHFIDCKTSALRDEFADKLVNIRKSKGLTRENALSLLDDELYFGVMLVKAGMADGMVAGAAHATSDVLRPALQILKTKPGTQLVSAFFMMEVPDCSYGENGLLMFADCALNIDPTSEELANIAIESGKSWQALTGTEPHIAMLSFSTFASANHEKAFKVAEATAFAQYKAPMMSIDGEMQLDAALVNSVARQKASRSSVAGKANVLVFPNLDSGNIGYKLVQRLAKADAYGPILQGIGAPVNDLSRGCSVEDIVGVVAITAVQAQIQSK